jgi:hypothetical protein
MGDGKASAEFGNLFRTLRCIAAMAQFLRFRWRRRPVAVSQVFLRQGDDIACLLN